MNANQKLKTVREQVTDHIRKQVITGKYQPGDALRETELATHFGVSRGPVRDALLQLSQEGLLEYRRNSGMTVGTPPSDETRSLIVQLRRQIELFIVDHSFEQYTDKDRMAWGITLQDLKSACEKAAPSEIVLADVAFHEAILASGCFQELLPIWKQLCFGMRFTYTRLSDNMHIYAEHKNILDAYDCGDKHAMLKALEENLI